VISASPNEKTLRKLALVRGVETIEVSSKNYNEGLSELEEKLRKLNGISENSIIILTYGMRDEPVHIVKIVQLRGGEQS